MKVLINENLKKLEKKKIFKATKMELENAYKVIKHLQADLNLLKSKSESINFIDKLDFFRLF